MSYLLKIDNTEISKMKKFKVGRNKLWANADRNLSGELRSDFIGIFPKISVEMSYLTATEMVTLISLLDTPQFTISYYDVSIDDYRSGTYYASDYELSVYDVEKELYEPMSFSLVPFNKQAEYIPSA